MLLALGMTKSDVAAAPEIRSINAGGVRAWFMELDEVPAEAERLRDLAVRSHRLVATIFESATIIPFRFPAVLATETELLTFLEKHCSTYAAELARLEGKAQLRITVVSPPAEPAAKPTTGTEYLRRRAEVAERLRSKVATATGVLPPGAEVRERPRDHSVLLLALVARSEVSTTLQSLRQKGFTATGPWPPTEFATCYPQDDARPE